MAALKDLSELKKSTNIYISRHLQRIDDTDSNDPKKYRTWIEQTKNEPKYVYNPYLTDLASEKKNIDKTLAGIKTDVSNIDIIITSPFLRCIQTAYLLLGKINEHKIINGLKIMELMKEFDSDDQDENNNPITKDDKERRNYLRNKAEEYIKLLLYNNRNEILNKDILKEYKNKK